MPEKSNKPRPNFHEKRFTQISESHCGPAVIQMLLANLDIEVTQEAIAEAGGATELIELQGMRVDQLARAVAQLAPEASFWYKDHAKLEDLVALVSEYRYPVGVEWQGVFEDDIIETQETGNDYGHYSAVIIADIPNRQLVIADPYKDFSAQDRIFSFEDFEPRWWDTNEVTDPATGEPKLIEDYHMMFILTPPGTEFPTLLGMKRG